MGTILRRHLLRIVNLRTRILLLVALLAGTYVLVPLFLWTYNVERANMLISTGLVWPSPRTIDNLPVLKDNVSLEHALGYLAAAMRWRPGNERAYRLAGQIYVARGDLITAAQILETPGVSTPRNMLSAWDASLVYERMWQTSLMDRQDGETNQYAQLMPEAQMRKSWVKAGVGWEEFIRQAKDAIIAKSTDAARVWAARARMTDLETGEAWYSLGQVYKGIGDVAEARLAYEEASRLSPDNRDIWYELGTIYLQDREGTKALGAYSQALDASSGTAGRSLIYYRIGTAHQSYLVPRDPVAAWEAYEQALILDDFATHPVAKALTYVNRGQLRAAEKRWDDALAEYTLALALDPENVQAHYLRAAALWGTGNHAQAREALEKLISRKPDYKESYRLLGNFAQEEDDFEEARKMYRRVLEIDPRDERARKALEELE